MISDIKTLNPIANARRLVDIYEASAPKVQRAMVGIFNVEVDEGMAEGDMIFSKEQKHPLGTRRIGKNGIPEIYVKILKQKGKND